MIIKAIQQEFMIKKADRYFRKAQWLHYITKWAEGADDILGSLNEYVEKVKNSDLYDNLQALLDNYNGFLEETGPHKPTKDLAKAGNYSQKARDILNDIGKDSYIDPAKGGFFQEDEDFEPETFLDLLEAISQDIENKIDEIGDVPEYDEAAEVKMAVVDLLGKAKGDPNFVQVLNSGNINNTITYLKNNMPEITQMMSQIENIADLNANDWEEIMQDMSNIQADPYQQKMRIIDRSKEKEAKEVWKAKNPLKYLESKKRDWANFKAKLNSNPELKRKYLEGKKLKRDKFISELTELAKTDPLAKAKLNKFRETENSRVMQHFNTNEAYKLLNKYLTAIMGEATRSFATSLAVELLAAHPELSQLKGPEREAKKKEIAKTEAKSSPKFIQYATDPNFRFQFVMNNNYSKKSLRDAETKLGPELYPKLLEAIKNYKPRSKQ